MTDRAESVRQIKSGNNYVLLITAGITKGMGQRGRVLEETGHIGEETFLNTCFYLIVSNQKTGKFPNNNGPENFAFNI